MSLSLLGVCSSCGSRDMNWAIWQTFLSSRTLGLSRFSSSPPSAAAGGAWSPTFVWLHPGLWCLRYNENLSVLEVFPWDLTLAWLSACCCVWMSGFSASPRTGLLPVIHGTTLNWPDGHTVEVDINPQGSPRLGESRAE